MLTARDYKKLPDEPGVYLMHDAAGRVLYVGKAGNLRRRVSSYFERPHDVRIETLVRKIVHIDFRQTDTALEALILEAELIKTLTPPFNVREKDDKSFLYVEITKEKFPRVLLVRGKDGETGKRYGPFTSASSIREALRILRKIFPWSTHDPERLGKFTRPCFDYEIGLCPGTCVGAISHEEYIKTIERLKLFFEGKKKKVLRSLEAEMKAASKTLDFEKAQKLRGQIFALTHIRDTALISDSEVLLHGDAPSENAGARDYRIEGYDISNISGTAAVGSMVVFEGNEPNKNEYRKFKIRTIFTPNDVGMLTEMLTRRFSRAAAGGKRSEMTERHSWRLPDLILIDGGIAQANAAKKVLMRAGLRIPLVGIAKGPERKRNDILGAVPKWTNKQTLIKVRNEAHRFAIGYHKAVRGRNFLS
ncbi:MAG TPA: excinuclease ABC subunit UvrC [Candidatus Paceibacterota bacterium]|jgi:excinuclease ABC subunit C|nr:excinuclease ABC subunit UvrC [Candidatus Paceibacterota bacterium]